jgi:hypothetical protein
LIGCLREVNRRGCPGGAADECNLYRSSLKARKKRKSSCGDIAQQVSERQEGKRSVCHGLLARQNPARTVSGLDRVLPHYGLAYSLVTGDGQRCRCLRRSRKKCPDLGDLGIPPDWHRIHRFKSPSRV